MRGAGIEEEMEDMLKRIGDKLAKSLKGTIIPDGIVHE